MTPDDKVLLDYLKRRRPEEWQAAGDLLAKLLVALRPELLRYVGRFNRLHDVEDFVDKVILTAWNRYRDQYLGKTVRMPFSDQNADTVDDLLRGWIYAMIGKPFAGARSGMVTNAIRQQDADASARSDVDVGTVEQEHDPDEGDFFDVAAARANVESVLRKLPPRKEFVFRVHTGLHDEECLSPDGLIQIARASRLDESSRKYIKAIAKEVLRDHGVVLALDQATVGRLVAIKERQVRNIVSEARAAIRAARLTHQ